MFEDLNLFRTLVRSLETDDDYIASALRSFCRQEHLTTVGALMDRLQIDESRLLRLALCKMPKSTSPDFATRIGEIADVTGTNVTQLASILRQVEFFASNDPSAPNTAAESVSGSESGQPPLLAAARDRAQAEQNESV